MAKGKRKTNTGPGVIRSFFSSFDLFKIDIEFREGKQENFSTVFGVLISIFILTVVILYGLRKAQTMKEYSDSTHQTIIEQALRGEEPLQYNETRMDFGAINLDLGQEYAEWSLDQLVTFELRESISTSWNSTKLSGFHKCNEEDFE